ncbi:MAG: peptide chain release factor N(5)-glutamine methyltransferase [Alphaproteobacteria bacterium]
MMVGQFGAALASVAERLAQAGIANPRSEARALLAAAAECEIETVFGYPERDLTPVAEARLDGYLRRRQAGEPLSRILGRREFWGLTFAIDAATLDPRPDSEILVAAALAAFPDRDRALRGLDLGTGSGCLLLAVLSERPQAIGIGVDRNAAACRMARRNAWALGLGDRARFLCADWAEPIAGRFDIILCNPPYIEDGAIAALAPEVALYDPRSALSGGADGLDAYRRIGDEIARCLAPDGLAFIEIGFGQATAVSDILSANLETVGRRLDLAGIERCLIARNTKKAVGFGRRPD